MQYDPITRLPLRGRQTPRVNMNRKNGNQKNTNKNDSSVGLFRIIGLLLIIAVIEIAIGHYYMNTLDKFVQYPDNNRIPFIIGSSDQKQQIATNDNSGVLPEEGNSGQKNNQQEDVAKTISNANSFLRQQQQQQQEKHKQQEEPGKNPISHPLTADANDKNSSPLKIKHILEKAGVQVTEDILSKLPPYAEVVNMYGDSPVIEGLETCEAFRTSVKNINRLVGPSGMFNSGTNLLAELLESNCFIPERRNNLKGTGMRWQVPWGKHTPASHRFKHHTDSDIKTVQKNVLPVVVIKDPYSWMGSMCRHTYSANWKHTEGHCPNLLPNDVDMTQFSLTAEAPIPVEVAYHPLVGTKQYSSLAGLWNDWYGAYYTASFPRLMIRFEDLLFHPESVITQVCSCAGGEMKSSVFQYVSESAKGTKGPHKGSSGLDSAIIRYSNAQKRVDGFTSADLDYASRELNQDMISTFSYAKPMTTAAA